MSDVETFLNELAVAVQKQAMYPPGHPALRTVSEDLARQLRELLAENPQLTIGGAKDRLIVEGEETEPGRALIGSLAARLHDHQIAALHFMRGADAGELDGLLHELAVDAERRGRPIGLEPLETLPTWPHVRIEPVEYEALKLDLAPPDGEIGDVDEAMPTLDEIGPEVDRAAAALAEVDVSPDLLELVSDLEEPYAEPAAARQLASLLKEIPPEELKRLLDSQDAAFAARLIRRSTTRLSPKAVVELVEAASSSEARPIGPWLLRLLAKLAYYAESSPHQDHPGSDETLREVVHELVDDWRLEDPRPAAYTGALGVLSTETAGAREEGARPFLADRLVMMGLELEMMGRMVSFALRDLRGTKLAELLELLEAASDGSQVAEVMWRQVATRDTLAQVLDDDDPDFDIVDRLVERIGVGAAEPLLDALQRTPSSAVCVQLVKRLRQLGPVIAGAITARLDTERPEATAHFLTVLNQLGVQAPGLTVAPFLAHPDPDIRGEAYRFAFRHSRDRQAAFEAALSESDPRLLAIGLTAAEEKPPPGSEPVLRRHVQDNELPVQLRLKAVRALSRHRTETALDGLVRSATQRRWLGARSIAPPSPVVLEALTRIRQEYQHLPRAREILQQAAVSEHRTIRAAAGAEPGSTR